MCICVLSFLYGFIPRSGANFLAEDLAFALRLDLGLDLALVGFLVRCLLAFLLEPRDEEEGEAPEPRPRLAPPPNDGEERTTPEPRANRL